MCVYARKYLIKMRFRLKAENSNKSKQLHNNSFGRTANIQAEGGLLQTHTHTHTHLPSYSKKQFIFAVPARIFNDIQQQQTTYNN